jgi:hypothetical protein
MGYQKLQLRGVVFDKVESIVHEMPYITLIPTLPELANLRTTTQEMKQWDNTFRELVKALDGKEYFGIGQHPRQAYWRTLIFNSHETRIPFGSAIGNDREFYYGAWVSYFKTFNAFCL